DQGELLPIRPSAPMLRPAFGRRHNRPNIADLLPFPNSKPSANSKPDRSGNERLKAVVNSMPQHQGSKQKRASQAPERVEVQTRQRVSNHTSFSKPALQASTEAVKLQLPAFSEDKIGLY